MSGFDLRHLQTSCGPAHAPIIIVKMLDLSTRLKADVSSVSPSSERIKELWVALGLYGEWWSYAIGRNMAT